MLHTVCVNRVLSNTNGLFVAKYVKIRPDSLSKAGAATNLGSYSLEEHFHLFIIVRRYTKNSPNTVGHIFFKRHVIFHNEN